MKNTNLTNTITFNVLVMLGMTIAIIYGISSYLFLKNSEDLIRDIETHEKAYLKIILDSREQNSLQVDRAKVEKEINLLAKHSSEYLQNFDKVGLQKMLTPIMNEKGIMLLYIWDHDYNGIFILAFKKDGKVIFRNEVPKEFEHFEKFTANITETIRGTKHLIGEATIYYDNSHILKKIALLKDESDNIIGKFNAQIIDRLDSAKKTYIIIYLISLLVVLIIMAFLLKKLVNDPLVTLKSGLDNFFLFIQNKRNIIGEIDIYSKDEFGEIARSLNESIEVSGKFHEKMHQLNIDLDLTTKKTKNLLNNSSQGFLTFDKEFIIDDEYSKMCEEIFGFNIANKNILNLLFLEDDENMNKSKSILLYALNTDDELSQASMLTLVPNEVILNKMFLKLEYRIIEDNKFMLIITNVSDNTKLESDIKKERSVLKMIPAIMQNSDMFHDVKNDFEYFATNKDTYINSKQESMNNLNNIYRVIHTFKGLFLQLFMNDTANHLHKIESQFSDLINNNPEISNEKISKFLNEIDFKKFTSNDCNNITKLLGEKFAHHDDAILVYGKSIKAIKYKCISFLEDYNIDTQVSKEIISDMAKLLQKPLINHLSSYTKPAMQLAQKLEKEIYEFEVKGNKETLVSEHYKPFIKSLVHIFRNSVDHGIETAEKRTELNKDRIGTVACSFELIKDNLVIVISDDGAGINIEKLKDKIKTKIDVSKLSDEDIYLYIFDDHISTKDNITETSGRGVGMSVVKSEVEKIGGNIRIQSKSNVGTTFIFNVPFKDNDSQC